MSDTKDVRREYQFAALDRASLAESPHAQFKTWLDAALAAGLKDATAMALATADIRNRPSVRIVLLKHYDAAGYCWYTDYRSPKASDLASNGHAELLFYWRELDRQTRISGVVERLSEAESDRYFASRPLESRLSAAASKQSAPVENRKVLEARVAQLRREFPDGTIPRPRQWGGYRLVADRFEFWQGREGRLHDRFRYEQEADYWRIERLQP